MKKLFAVALCLTLAFSCFAAFATELDYSTYSAVELQELINRANVQLDQLRAMHDTNTDDGAVVFAGSGTDIVLEVSVPNVPARVTYKQDNPSSFTVSYIRGADERSLMSEHGTDNGCAVLDKEGVYDFIVESNEEWAITIEPLTTVNAIEFAGTGNYVTDIFPINKSTIIELAGEYADFTNFIVYVWTNGKYGWSSSNLLNGLQSGGDKVSEKKVIKTTEPTLAFITIDFCDSPWSIKAVGK